MDFFEMVERRRSIRRFLDKKISKEVIEKILNAALSAPSSKNCHSSSFMVIEKPEVAEKLSLMRDSGSTFLKNAPLIILVMGDEKISDMWSVNAAISATYLQLATEASGMGSCWVQVEGRMHRSDDHNAGSAEEYIKSFLPIPDGRRVLCAIALGYPETTEHKPISKGDETGRILTI